MSSQQPLDVTNLMLVLEVRRKQLALTHTELARRTGISRRMLIAFLVGHTELSLRVLLRIASALDLVIHVTANSQPPGNLPPLDSDIRAGS